MHLGAAGLQEQPFRVHGKPLTYVTYEARDAAVLFLQQIVAHRSGLGVFLGPTLSGKTTILHSFAESLDLENEVAIIDGEGINAQGLLEGILHQYGFQVDLDSVNEHMNMLKVYVLQRAASGVVPVLIIENVHAMNPSALRVVCELAKLKVRVESAMRIILSSNRLLDTIIESPVMAAVSARKTGEFHLAPLTEYETADYLYEKLRAGGCSDPENVIPDPVCDAFYAASGGWPGVLDRLVLLALAKAHHCPLSKEHIERPRLDEWEGLEDEAETNTVEAPTHPLLYLTRDGKTVRKLVFKDERLIIGRSDHNDLLIDSRFVSRHHALFIRHGSTTLLMDLNSTNGTFVNSRRISNQVLAHNDIVSIGNHRLKFIHAAAQDDTNLGAESGFADTVIMKSLQDMRRMLATENTQSLPVVPEEASASPDA